MAFLVALGYSILKDADKQIWEVQKPVGKPFGGDLEWRVWWSWYIYSSHVKPIYSGIWIRLLIILLKGSYTVINSVLYIWLVSPLKLEVLCLGSTLHLNSWNKDYWKGRWENEPTQSLLKKLCLPWLHFCWVQSQSVLQPFWLIQLSGKWFIQTADLMIWILNMDCWKFTNTK